MEAANASQRVLVVDDEPSLVDAVSTALRYEGFEVIEATTGRAGLAAAQDVRADLIVLDVMLPDLDGFAVTTRLRQDGITSPVLFSSEPTCPSRNLRPPVVRPTWRRFHRSHPGSSWRSSMQTGRSSSQRPPRNRVANGTPSMSAPSI